MVKWLSALIVVGCGGDVIEDGGFEGGVRREASTDTSVDVGMPAREDAPMDAPIGSLTGSISNPVVYQNCQPIVAKDPVIVSLDFKVTNAGSVPIGPLTPTAGRLLDANDNPILTFTFDANPLGPVAPSSSAQAKATKKPGTANPANGCDTLKCSGQEVKVEMELSGDAVPKGFKLTSALTGVSCVY